MIGRFARTITKQHPLQVAARLPNAVVARAVWNVPDSIPPRSIGSWPSAPGALRSLANAEQARGEARLSRLPPGRLRAYEECYGLELGAEGRAPRAEWKSRVAIEPFPASVRARRIAVAIRCGGQGLERELARAARAVIVRPELHLMGNHLLENGFALACAGAAARGLESDLWWRAGTRLLGWQLRQQFLVDGGHVERSASYHLALTAALLETIELAHSSGRGVPPMWKEVAARALGWAAYVRAPDGTYPLFNDAALDASPTVDAVLDLGRALDINPWPMERLEATGWVCVQVDSARLVVDAGPDADGWQPGHAHADGLAFELWVHGKRVVVDFGVSSYEPGQSRDETRATRSHNTVELGGQDSCEVWGGFRVGRRGRGRVATDEVRAGAAHLELEHDGYAWLPGAPRHVRSMQLRPGRLEVKDRIMGGSEAWVSRLRVDAATGVRVGSYGGVSCRDDRWYPRHAEACPARVYEQRGRAGSGEGVVWLLEW